MQLAVAEDLFPRLGGYGRFTETFEGSRRALAPAYIDYIFTVSPAVHAVSLQLASFLLTLCRAAAPSSVADLGSGFSSHVLRAYAEEANQAVRVVSVDDSLNWLVKTREFLERCGSSVEGLVPWDDFKRNGTGDFDVILYDLGTVETRARELSTVLAAAKPGALIILDDLHFPAYRKIVEKAASERHFVAYDLEELTRDEYGRFAWALVR